MKLDRLAISLATTAALSAVAILLFRRSEWIVATVIVTEVAAFLAFGYLDLKKTQKFRKGTGFAVVAAIVGDLFLVEATTQPGHPLMLISAGGFSVLYLFRTIQAFREKPATPSALNQPGQIPETSFEPNSKAGVPAARQ